MTALEAAAAYAINHKAQLEDDPEGFAHGVVDAYLDAFPIKGSLIAMHTINDAIETVRP